MTLKNFIFLMITFVAAGFYIMKNHPDHAFDILGIVFAMAILAELGRMFLHRNKSAGPLLKKPRFQETHDEDGNVYHNDFSKVPAGTADSSTPRPMPRGVIIGDPYRAFEENFREDMERLGLKDEDQSDRPKSERP